MNMHNDTISISTDGNSDVVNISPDLADCIRRSGVTDGIAHIFCSGSTGSLTTTEFEPGCIRDLKEYLNLNMPPTPPGPPWGDYFHHETWHDDNGHSHLRASVIGPDVTIPIRNGQPRLGTWQQVIFIDHDTRSRQRELLVTIIGE